MLLSLSNIGENTAHADLRLSPHIFVVDAITENKEQFHFIWLSDNTYTGIYRSIGIYLTFEYDDARRRGVTNDVDIQYAIVENATDRQLHFKLLEFSVLWVGPVTVV